MMKRVAVILLVMLLTLCAASALADKTLTITFTGDVTLGSEEVKRRNEASFDSFAQREGYDYFFANVVDLFRGDDLTVVNLEGILSDSSANEKKTKTYRFRGPADFVNILTRNSIEAVNLANNHTMDYEKRGYQDTTKIRTTAGVDYFGNTTVWTWEKDGIKIGFIGQNGTTFAKNRNWAKQQVEELKAGGVSFVVFVFHGGTEYAPHKTTQRFNSQEFAAQFMIDAGVDLVIMHHPHVVQGYDVYKNRTICYSLGNFCFGGNKQVRAIESLVVQADLTFADDGTYLGQQLRLYPAHISGTNPDSNYQPVFVKGEEAQAVMAIIQNDSSITLNPFQDELGYALQDYVPAVAGTEENRDFTVQDEEGN